MGAEIVAGVMTVGSGFGGDNIKNGAKITEGIASLLGVGFGNSGPSLSDIVNEIYENVYRVVSEMFEQHAMDLYKSIY